MDKPIANAGRSRGRGRASNPQQQGNGGRGRRPNQPGVPGSSGAFVPAAAPATSAWGQHGGVGRGGSAASFPAPSAAVQAQPSCSTGAVHQRAPAPAMQGRATAHRNAAVGDAKPTMQEEPTRGAVRGRRIISELVRSRPAGLVSKCGASGRRVVVQSNYFCVLKKPEWTIHQYRVDFSPDVDLMRQRRYYLAQHKDKFGGYIFDGTILFSANLFTNENDQLELLTKNKEDEIIQIKIKRVGLVDVSDMQQIQVLNLILRRAMEHLKLQLVGRSLFDPQEKIDLASYKLQIWPGYQTSIRQHENEILLCTDIAHKVMRTDTVYSILNMIAQSRGDFQAQFKREVVGMIVLTDYNNKTYRVDDVDFNASPMSKFLTKDREVSYFEYYRERYNKVIQDQRQPLLVSRPTEKNIRGGNDELIMLVPELCRATGMTDEMRSNFRLMKAMGEHTRLVPERRIERLYAFNKRLQECGDSKKVLNEWSLKLDSNLVQIPARVLTSEKIVFGDQKRYQCDQRADWTREFRGTSMYSHVDIKRWIVIVPSRNAREVQEFVQMCIKAAKGMRMNISSPLYEHMQDDRIASYSRAIDSAASKDPQIVMPVLVSQNEEKYSCIKKKCCVDRPVPSQVVTLRVIAPRGDKASGLMSVATKVVIQMNAKLMGAPWMIELPINGLMTVGFDVCHSGKDKNKSFGALVATMDLKRSSRYFSTVSEHMKGQELSNEISMKMGFALKAYRDTHGDLPERIIFYRDGVGDGQLHQVANTELQFLRKSLEEIYKNAGGKSPRLAFVVVSKRINTRYFLNKQNPPPGTVVDDVITLPERYDFFLVSQSVRQGTVSPTSYNVIYDTMGLNADRLQMLTYKMTHLYYNWSGTCRVPAVCQYAHKLAFLVAESIHRSPSNTLENQLYFL